MSLTLHWDQRTYRLESDGQFRGSIHHIAQPVERVSKNIHIVRIGMLTASERPTFTGTAVLKMARNTKEICALEKEALIYKNDLKDIQGKYVPRYYGIYHGEVLRSPVACMLLEHCQRGNTRMHEDERNRKIMLAACAVHAAGIEHGDLLSGHNLLTSGEDVKILDFSQAETHECYGATPTLYPGVGGDSESSQYCQELVDLEAAYGVFSGAAFPAPRTFVVNPFRVAQGNSLGVLARRVAGMVIPQ